MNLENNYNKYYVNPDKWTVSKNSEKNSTKKYPITVALCILGLVFISMLKTESRKLQKEINDLQSSLYKTKITLNEASLDYEYLTSPENIEKLAKQYLEINYTHYKKEQIQRLDDADKKIILAKIKVNNEKVNNEKVNNEKVNNDIVITIKNEITKKIEKKKSLIKKIRRISSNPKNLPKEIKFELSNNFIEKRKEIIKIYKKPEDFVRSGKFKSWAGIQFVKLIFGIPIVPGE